MKNFITMLILLIINCVMASSVFAQVKRNGKGKLRYRDIEKRASQSLTINVGDGGLSGITIDRRFVKDFANQLPSREDFKPEVNRSIRRVK